jgi:hypothetical protein
MRHLHPVTDAEPDLAAEDFPPGWDDFQAARQRFFARLVAESELAARRRPGAEPPGEASAS